MNDALAGMYVTVVRMILIGLSRHRWHWSQIQCPFKSLRAGAGFRRLLPFRGAGQPDPGQPQ